MNVDNQNFDDQELSSENAPDKAIVGNQDECSAVECLEASKFEACSLKKDSNSENPIPDDESLPEVFSDESDEDESCEEYQEEGMNSSDKNHSDEGREESSEKSSDSKELNRKQVYETFLAQLEAIEDVEGKLRHVISFMASALATKQGTPYFKGFWDARTIALQLFKENINPISRTEYWNKYAELSKEARRLKETLDEQSAFASEQIEIAIKAIENEQENIAQAVGTASGSDLLKNSQALKTNSDYYVATQQELNLLNAHASRITALRKELIRIEMRVRQKNKFFQRLSSAGDKTFPRRKELIKELSQNFSADVDNFVQQYFADESFQESFFYLREEIKTLQAIAKLLTLNTQSFTYTRMRLSECWDKLKSSDKERKKQRAQHKALYKENAQALQAKLVEIDQQMQASTLSNDEVHDALDAVFSELRNVELGRDEIKALRDQIGSIRQPLIEKARLEEQGRLNQILDREKLKKFRLQEIKNEIGALLTDLDAYNAISLTAKRDEFMQKIFELQATKMEKQELDRLLKPVRDVIVEKKEMDVLSLSDDDRQAIEQLKKVLQQRKERRQEIKKQLELLRKESGNSGLDFEKAINFNTLMAAEKERLEKISEGIKEIEDKIAVSLKIKDNAS
ncbi:MAG: hypothetical protein H0W50_05180 [Parachlamydiaceae bacterium]|nr:hypothetical protein [Parachlamydiaceae bacterium]